MVKITRGFKSKFLKLLPTLIIIGVIFLYLNFIKSKRNDEKISNNREQYKQVVESCENRIVIISQLNKIFGKGEVSIRYFLPGYGKPACLWERTIFNKYKVQYEIPITVTADRKFEKELPDGDKGSVWEITQSSRDSDGRLRTRYGKTILLNRELVLRLFEKEIDLESLGIYGN